MCPDGPDSPVQSIVKFAHLWLSVRRQWTCQRRTSSRSCILEFRPRQKRRRAPLVDPKRTLNTR